MSLSIKYIPVKASKSFRSSTLSSMILELRGLFPSMRLTSDDLDSVNGKSMNKAYPAF